MSAPERRLLWALLVGAVVFGFKAGETNAWFFNLLVGAAYAVPATIAAWALLEGVSWAVKSPDPQQQTPRQPSNVRVMDRDRYTRGDDRRPE